MLCRIVSQRGGFWSLENPASSRLWLFEPIVRLRTLPDVIHVTWDMCQFKAPHKKPTTLLTNMADIASLGRRCTGGHVHETLQGTVRTCLADGRYAYRNRTSLAGAYTSALCDEWAQLVVHGLRGAARGVPPLHERTTFLERLRRAAMPRLVGQRGGGSGCHRAGRRAGA